MGDMSKQLRCSICHAIAIATAHLQAQKLELVHYCNLVFLLDSLAPAINHKLERDAEVIPAFPAGFGKAFYRRNKFIPCFPFAPQLEESLLVGQTRVKKLVNAKCTSITLVGSTLTSKLRCATDLATVSEGNLTYQNGDR